MRGGSCLRWLGVLVGVSLAAPALADDGVGITGYVRSYAGLWVEAPNDYSILQNTLQTELTYSGDVGGLMVSPYVYQYPTAGYRCSQRLTAHFGRRRYVPARRRPEPELQRDSESRRCQAR